jgi:DNA modification methylase
LSAKQVTFQGLGETAMGFAKPYRCEKPLLAGTRGSRQFTLEILLHRHNLFANCSKAGICQMDASSDAALPVAVIYRPVATLRPDPRNARTHPKQQVDQIVASIREFGFVNPILADPDGRIIAGHGRLMAAKALGLAEVPTILIPGLSEAQKRALRIADNKIALGAGWDIDVLKLELTELRSLDLEFDLSVTGFSTGELDVILNGSADPDDDVIPEAPASPRTRLGDIWILGEHRVGCGDARDLYFVRRLVGEEAAIDTAFLDPPYNVRISGHANAVGRRREFAMASGEMDEAEFRAFLTQTLEVSASVSRHGAVHFVCIDWRHMDDVSAVGKAVYGDLLNVCVWNKSNAGMGSLYRSKHELVFVFRVGDMPHFNAVELGKHGRNRTNVWDYASVNSFKGSRREDLALHPTVKPSALVADAIQDVTRRGDLVLDLFLGSGTTLVAAERVGRRFRGLDIDPAYVDVAIDRWTNMTGGVPERAEGSAA